MRGASLAATLRFGIKVGAQEGLPYRRLVEVARAAEAEGFESFFRSDHWRSTAGQGDRDATDAWTTLAGLARDTDRIRLGTLVSPVAFRGPFEMAKVTATVDELSAGRVEVGLGAGWHAAEHLPLGLPFGALSERFERLEEQLGVLPRLWTGEAVSHSGRHYRLDAAVSLPRPVQRPGPPLIIGGKGRPRGLRLAVAHAAEYDLDTVGPDACADVGRRLGAACAAAGRPRGSIVLSVMTAPARGVERLRRQIEAYATAGIERIILDIGTAPGGADVAGLAASLRASIGWPGGSAISR